MQILWNEFVQTKECSFCEWKNKILLVVNHIVPPHYGTFVVEIQKQKWSS